MKVWIIDDEIKLTLVLWYYKKLRPQYSEGELEVLLKEQLKQGYKIAFLNNGADDFGIAGFFIRENLAHGKHLYIEDLLTKGQIQGNSDNPALSNDVYSHLDADEHYGGVFLIKWLKRYAKDNGCNCIKVDSLVGDYYSHRYLLKTGFEIAAHTCTLLLPANEN